MLNLLTTGQGGGIMETVSSFGMIAIMLVAFYFLLIRPQKKKEKEQKALRDNLEVGDEIVTIGGIVGLIVSVKDDVLVIETGSDRSKIRLMRWAVQENVTGKEA